MFDSWKRSKFYVKCKSLTRLTKIRLENLKKKKCTVAKYLKQDIADLLKNNLDDNAFGRVEGFLVEENVIDCYEYLEQFCQCILSNLKDMEKQKQCPDQCKEAVQSLIFAAARFAEFPELRDLRALFANRYGNPDDHFIKKELVEKLKPQIPSKEMKIQVMHDIAKEFSIQWNSTLFEVKLFPQERETTEQKYVSEETISEDKQIEETKLGLRDEALQWRKHQKVEKRNSFAISREGEGCSWDSRHSSSRDSLQSTSIGSISEDEEDNRRSSSYRSISPPYSKPKENEQDMKTSDGVKPEGEIKPKPKPRSVRSRPQRKVQDNANEDVQRPLKPPPGREYLEKQKPPLMEQEERKEERIFREINCDEKVLDGILLYYGSKKGEKKMKVSKSRMGGSGGGGSFCREGRGGFGELGWHARSVSMQPEIITGHVHPNLPDYDDLAARLATLRGR